MRTTYVVLVLTMLSAGLRLGFRFGFGFRFGLRLGNALIADAREQIAASNGGSRHRQYTTQQGDAKREAVKRWERSFHGLVMGRMFTCKLLAAA